MQVASGNFATISGGRENFAFGDFATIGGGSDNSAESCHLCSRRLQRGAT
jgi:hypothetical protein